MNEEEIRAFAERNQTDVLNVLLGEGDSRAEVLLEATADTYDILVENGVPALIAADTLVNLVTHRVMMKLLEPPGTEES